MPPVLGEFNPKSPHFITALWELKLHHPHFYRGVLSRFSPKWYSCSQVFIHPANHHIYSLTHFSPINVYFRCLPWLLPKCTVLLAADIMLVCGTPCTGVQSVLCSRPAENPPIHSPPPVQSLSSRGLFPPSAWLRDTLQ